MNYFNLQAYLGHVDMFGEVQWCGMLYLVLLINSNVTRPYRPS